ncbi:Rieske (2Fe-2S) protein [Paenibacillus oceani]|uniref:Rieske (2Fe-2S) protein n=1 Tax=Paenibacillus oceani TaxID=2772510 RepID=A0A927H2T8_9BACL|nr:Rieske (2Fe-2S) protein [Paenibacillus oceani]MBD2865713.1 Rieske (2Fe-2S) protein [Paenibacillus oceani]
MKRYLVAKSSDLPEGGRKLADVNGVQIGLFRLGEDYYAWRNMCPHMAAPACRGEVCGTRLPSMVYEYDYGMEGQVLRCPWHGWEFDLRTGRHLVDANVKLIGYKVETEQDQIYVWAP